jgi:hypothetical protein
VSVLRRVEICSLWSAQECRRCSLCHVMSNDVSRAAKEVTCSDSSKGNSAMRGHCCNSVMKSERSGWAHRVFLIYVNV